MRRLKVRLEKLLKRTLGPAVVCALAVTACGSQQQKPPASTATTTNTPTRDSRTIAIYSSLPSAGPDRAAAVQIRDGIRVALGPVLAAGSYHGLQVQYTPLNDSFARRVVHHHGASSANGGDKSHSGATVITNGNTNGWNPTAAADDAEKASSNRDTVAYIGDLNSGATKISLPILNQAGILQITPGSGYAGLTDSFKPPITQPGEPSRYYPQKAQTRTLLRLIPSDIIQAAAAVEVLHQGGCQRLAAWEFSPAEESNSLFAAVQQTAAKYNMTYVATSTPPSTLSKIYGYVAETLKPKQIGCVVLVGHVTRTAALLTTELREVLSPSPPIVGTNGFCNTGWVRQIPKAYAPKVVSGLSCTTPIQPISTYPGGRRFSARFHAVYSHVPVTAYAYYGYEAAEFVLRALHQLGRGEDYRQQVLASVSEDILSAGTGTYTYDSDGIDRYSSSYGIANFPHGSLRYSRAVTPMPLLSSG